MATKFKKKVKKVIFSLMAIHPPPLNVPAIKRRTFFLAVRNILLFRIDVIKKSKKSGEKLVGTAKKRLRYITNTVHICILSCVKIQKITNQLTLGQIKLYMGPLTKNPKKKNQNFDF